MSDRVGIPGSGFAQDDGTAAEEVTSALAAHAAGDLDDGAALEALLASRLLVPVVALAGGTERDADGPPREKASDMATVLVERGDGRRALLAFTSTVTLAAWSSEARPVPVAPSTAARAALQEGADALVVDIAGPHRFVVHRRDLPGVAGEWSLTRVGGRSAWIRPQAE